MVQKELYSFKDEWRNDKKKITENISPQYHQKVCGEGAIQGETENKWQRILTRNFHGTDKTNFKT